MASKRLSASRKSPKRPATKSRRKREPWIQAVWGQSVPRPKKALGAMKVRLRLKQGPGSVRSITLAFAKTKKALGK